MTERDLLAEGLKRLGLPIDLSALERLIAYLDLLEHWNRSHNLTAIRDRREALEKHLLDSLSLLPLLPEGCRLLDFGSGAGLPGLVLKLYRPDLILCSLEPAAKKAVFQRQVVRHFGLEQTRILGRRLEQLAAEEDSLRSFDRIVFRAVGPVDRYAADAARLLVPGGLLAAMKGGEAEAEWQGGTGLPDKLFRPWKKIDLTLPFSTASRSILVWEAV
ncbi:MAG: 16S rRNA (guanine(527)-N(7))-methyltransferase RsmG [Geothermobacteraceae bacterium]